MTTGPGDGTDRPHGRAGHESDRDYVDTDVASSTDVEREGAFVDKDVESSGPTSRREGDYTDKDVTEDDTDTPPASYVSKDVPS